METICPMKYSRKFLLRNAGNASRTFSLSPRGSSGDILSFFSRLDSSANALIDRHIQKCKDNVCEEKVGKVAEVQTKQPQNMLINIIGQNL
jgi:hypothetical protein